MAKRSSSKESQSIKIIKYFLINWFQHKTVFINDLWFLQHYNQIRSANILHTLNFISMVLHIKKTIWKEILPIHHKICWMNIKIVGASDDDLQLQRKMQICVNGKRLNFFLMRFKKFFRINWNFNDLWGFRTSFELKFSKYFIKFQSISNFQL